MMSGKEVGDALLPLFVGIGLALVAVGVAIGAVVMLVIR